MRINKHILRWECLKVRLIDTKKRDKGWPTEWPMVNWSVQWIFSNL